MELQANYIVSAIMGLSFIALFVIFINEIGIFGVLFGSLLIFGVVVLVLARMSLGSV